MKKIFLIVMLFALSAFADEMCVVTFKIKQSTFTLSISEHIKNEANKQFLQIPVDTIILFFVLILFQKLRRHLLPER